MNGFRACFYLSGETAFRLLMPASRGADWASWAHSDEAQEECSDPPTAARVESMQLLHLITALIRQDRFCEGTLLGACKSSVLL
ncbi:DUF6508 domain-containing protein [Hyphomicrobium sp. DY-1]|uniref:DUF6508 domain-containing protein n=1 Tax=Hyphomicrobium sp. DY-1 TaxID=3075650 RepID=UPI0039C48BA0